MKETNGFAIKTIRMQQRGTRRTIPGWTAAVAISIAVIAISLGMVPREFWLKSNETAAAFAVATFPDESTTAQETKAGFKASTSQAFATVTQGERSNMYQSMEESILGLMDESAQDIDAGVLYRTPEADTMLHKRADTGMGDLEPIVYEPALLEPNLLEPILRDPALREPTWLESLLLASTLSQPLPFESTHLDNEKMHLPPPMHHHPPRHEGPPHERPPHVGRQFHANSRHNPPPRHPPPNHR